MSGAGPGDNPAAAAKMLLCVFPAIAMIIAAVFSCFLHFREPETEDAAHAEGASTESAENHG